MGFLLILALIVVAFAVFYIFCVPTLSPKARYQVKMAFYYFLLFNYGLVVTILSSFTPKRLSNYKYPMWLIQQTGYLLRIKYRLEQMDKLKNLKGSYIIVSNHQSSIDLIGVGRVWPYDCTIVAKKSLLFAGWFGIGAWLCGCVFVSRGRESARKEMRRLADRMAKGDVPLRVWIFPEGTRHAGADLGEFKKGSFHLATQAQVPIVPVVFSNYSSFYSSEEKIFEDGEVAIRVLDPVSTEGKTADDVDELMGTVRDQMNHVYHELSGSAAELKKSD